MAMDAFAKARDDKYPQGHLHHKRNLIPELRDPCRD